MALTDSGARAMAIMMLNRIQLTALHDIEEKIGRPMNPSEIAWHNGFKGHNAIKEHWSIPVKEAAAQEHHASRIEGELWQLAKNKGVSRTFYDGEDRANFDWHVFNSGIDFSYRPRDAKSHADVTTDDF